MLKLKLVKNMLKIYQAKTCSILYVYFNAFRIAASSGYRDYHRVVLDNIFSCCIVICDVIEVSA